MARNPTTLTEPTLVNCRVTKAGHGKISTGERGRDEETGIEVDLTYDKEDRVTFPAQVAADLEDRGLVEVLDGDVALPPPTAAEPKKLREEAE